MAGSKLTLQGLDIIDVISFILRKNKKFQAVALNEIENILLDRPELYERIRKVYLDSSNNFARTVLKTIFGTVEQDEIDRLVR